MNNTIDLYVQKFNNIKLLCGKSETPYFGYVVNIFIEIKKLYTMATTEKITILKNQNFDSICYCNNFRFCDVLYILHNCEHNMDMMIFSHNMMPNVMVEAILKPLKVRDEEIKKINSLNLSKFKELQYIKMY
jgi:hypothetical protein